MKRLIPVALSLLLLGGAAAAASVPVAAQAAGPCTAQLGGSCGAYSATAQWPGSNGFNTYDSNQSFANSGSTQTMTAPDASSPSSVPMSIVANDVPYGYTGVQTFPDVQQLTNNYSTDGMWNGQDVDTPVDAMPAITVNYSETSPHGVNDIYEFAPDVWTNYAGQAGQGSGDLMFWADTTPVRCNDNGLSSDNIVGHVTLQGQNWTAYRYGGVGAEIVLILNTTSPDPVTTDTCAQQASGSIDIKGGLDWLNSQGLIPHGGGALTMGQLNTGWEITSAQNSTFTLSSYTIDTTGGSPSPSPTPTPTSPSPTPTETSPSPTPTPTPTGPAVSFVAAGGAKKARATSLSYTVNAGTGANRELLAEASLGVKNDRNCSLTVTDNGVPMTRLAVVHTNNQHDGYMNAWSRANPSAGVNVIAVHASRCSGGIPRELTSGAETFAGAGQVSVTTAFGAGNTVSIPATAADGNMAAVFAAAGSGLGTANVPAVNQFLENVDDQTGAGNSAGAILAGMNSPVTFPITATDWWAAVAVQLQHV